MTNADWRSRIVCDPAIHHGEPCIRGTRIAVSVIVSSLADLSVDDVLREYPQLAREDVKTALLYTAQEGNRAESERRSRRSAAITLLALAGIALAYCAILTFASTEITVDPNSESVSAIESRWWGLAKKERELRWIQPKGFELPAWMVRGPDGQWYPYIVEDSGWDAEPASP